MSKEILSHLKDLVNANLTPTEKTTLTEMGIVTAQGIFNLEVVTRKDGTKDMRKADEVTLATGARGARVGCVMAHSDREDIRVNLVKLASGKVFAESNIQQPRPGSKPWTVYIPPFKDGVYRDAWNAFKAILPAYLVQLGEL
jgi:hypothetical protein